MITKVWQRIHFYPRQKPLPNGDCRGAGIGLTSSEFFTSRHGQFFIVCAEGLYLFQRHIFQCQHDIVRATRVTDQLIEFQLKRCTSEALGVLNQEHHKKGYNEGDGNKDKLLDLTIVDERASQCPDSDVCYMPH
jgi:hypothetical protein